MTKIITFLFANAPADAFSPRGILAGFDGNATDVSGGAYQTNRAQALFKALGANPRDQKLVLGKLSDDRWALIGLAGIGHACAVEMDAPTTALTCLV